MRCGGEPDQGGRVRDDRELPRRDTEPDEPVAERLIDGHDRCREAAGEALLETQEPDTDAARTRAEARRGELRHRLVHVEDHGNPHESQREGREDQEVRQGVDLHEGIRASEMRADEREHRASEEREVFAQVDPEPSALVALDRQPVDDDALDRQRPGVTRPPEREDIDAVPRGCERLGLATNARILLVVRVREHRDPYAGWRGDRPLSGGHDRRSLAYGRTPRAPPPSPAGPGPRVPLPCRWT